MKKLLSVLLTVALLLCCASVFAETAETEKVVPAFELTSITPEGYEASEPEWIDPLKVFLTLAPTVEGKPAMMLFISYNDAFSDITFNADLPEDKFKEELDKLIVDEETGEKSPYEIKETGLGTWMVVIADPDNFTEFYTIWHGYEVSLMCANFDADNTPTPLNDDQMAVIMQYLTDLDMQMIIEEAPEA